MAKPNPFAKFEKSSKDVDSKAVTAASREGTCLAALPGNHAAKIPGHAHR